MIEHNWVGEWFTPFVGERYSVPLDAANYADLRGKTGMCTRVYQSAFGHAWAVLEIDGENHSVRTCYLMAEDGEPHKLVDELRAEHTPMQKVKYVWDLPDNSGTVVLKST